CTIPIQQLVGVPVDAFQVPNCSGGDSFDLATVGLSSARFVRIDASQLQPGAGGTAGFDLDAVAAVHFTPLAGATSTTTIATIGPGKNTTTPPGTGASQPGTCAPPGLHRGADSLQQLLPAPVGPS